MHFFHVEEFNFKHSAFLTKSCSFRTWLPLSRNLIASLISAMCISSHSCQSQKGSSTSGSTLCFFCCLLTLKDLEFFCRLCVTFQLFGGSSDHLIAFLFVFSWVLGSAHGDMNWGCLCSADLRNAGKSVLRGGLVNLLRQCPKTFQIVVNTRFSKVPWSELSNLSCGVFSSLEMLARKGLFCLTRLTLRDSIC